MFRPVVLSLLTLVCFVLSSPAHAPLQPLQEPTPIKPKLYQDTPAHEEPTSIRPKLQETPNSQHGIIRAPMRRTARKSTKAFREVGLSASRSLMKHTDLTRARQFHPNATGNHPPVLSNTTAMAKGVFYSVTGKLVDSFPRDICPLISVHLAKKAQLTQT